MLWFALLLLLLLPWLCILAWEGWKYWKSRPHAEPPPLPPERPIEEQIAANWGGLGCISVLAVGTALGFLFLHDWEKDGYFGPIYLGVLCIWSLLAPCKELSILHQKQQRQVSLEEEIETEQIYLGINATVGILAIALLAVLSPASERIIRVFYSLFIVSWFLYRMSGNLRVMLARRKSQDN
jgi:hypothetical protein